MNDLAYGLAARQVAWIQPGTFWVARAKHHGRVKVLRIEGTRIIYRKADGSKQETEGWCFTQSFKRAARQ